MSDYSSSPKGLEKLRSVFANNLHKKPEHTDVTQLDSDYDDITEFNKTDLRLIPSVSPFHGDNINKPYEKISILQNNSLYDN